MSQSKKYLFCRLDDASPQRRGRKRQDIVQKLGLIEDRAIPIFDEATQTAARILHSPISMLGIAIGDRYCLKSSVGLSQMGLMNEIARHRQLPLSETFARHVIDSHSYLSVENTLTDPFFAGTNFTQHYGIGAYAGTPLITSEGECIGTLEVFELHPRQFSEQEVEFLQMTARWCLAEYEKNQWQLGNSLRDNLALKVDREHTGDGLAPKPTEELEEEGPSNLTLDLLGELAERLSAPLTSVIGMASVLQEKIFGDLSKKQQEYLQIIYSSGQEMTAIIEEIINLGNFERERRSRALGDRDLELSTVDLEMIGQQIINDLQNYAKKQEQSLRLSVEPGNKIWSLDRRKIKQTIYYLLTAIIESARPASEIQIHICERQGLLSINFLIRHPWLQEGIPFEKLDIYQQLIRESDQNDLMIDGRRFFGNLSDELQKIFSAYEILSLLFSFYLAKLQGGNLKLVGSLESGYRFVCTLPAKK